MIVKTRQKLDAINIVEWLNFELVDGGPDAPNELENKNKWLANFIDLLVENLFLSDNSIVFGLIHNFCKKLNSDSNFIY